MEMAELWVWREKELHEFGRSGYECSSWESDDEARGCEGCSTLLHLSAMLLDGQTVAAAPLAAIAGHDLPVLHTGGLRLTQQGKAEVLEIRARQQGK